MEHAERQLGDWRVGHGPAPNFVHMTRIAVACALILAAILSWRPIAAWWCFDRGDRDDAALWFARGLALEPVWHTLLEDNARSIVDRDPAGALAELREADCGAPCVAEEGDAESRLGHAQDAV